MSLFIKLKKKILNKKLRPDSFDDFKFLSFNEINHKDFYSLIRKKRLGTSFKKK